MSDNFIEELFRNRNTKENSTLSKNSSTSINNLTRKDFIMTNTSENICNLNTFHRFIKQIPSKENGYVGICEVEISSQNGKVTDFGIASSEMLNGSKDQTAILELASTKALENVEKHQAKLPKTPLALHQHPVNSYEKEVENKRQYNHNPNKILSPKQLSMIQSTANQKGVSLKTLSWNRYNKETEKLSSQECHEIFQYLKSL